VQLVQVPPAAVCSDAAHDLARLRKPNLAHSLQGWREDVRDKRGSGRGALGGLMEGSASNAAARASRQGNM
jgi:hypothetical protein